MYNIILVQPGFSWGPTHLNSYYLPYSIGCLWAKCIENDEIKTNFELKEMIAVRENINSILDRYEQLDVVGFSCYVWNYNYNNALAKAIKEKFPDCLIVFGGPEPEHTDKNIFVNRPWIDCVAIQEGEITFEKILEAVIHKKSLYDIPGLIINTQGQRHQTEQSQRITDLESLPSPYLNKVFDHLFEKHPEINWTAILETNRGCPYKCTFCDWGSLTLNKIKKFLFEKVDQEIKWFADNKIEYVYVADANYGMFLERDLAITKLFGKYKSLSGYPQTVSVNWTKNAKKSVIKIAEEFHAQGNSLGVSVSLQSFHDDVLVAIERNNFELNNIADMAKECHARNIPVSVDWILGLPMETKESWKKTYYTLFDLDIHQNFYTHSAMLLENAPMNQKQVTEYNMKTYKRPIKFSKDNISHTEYATYVKSTSTMSHQDMIDCAMHSNWMYALHHTGLCSEQAKFVKKYLNVAYSIFYNDLIDFIKNKDYMQPCYNESLNQLKKFYNDIKKPSIENIELSLSGEFFILLYNIIQNGIEKKIQNSLADYIEKKYKLDKDLYEQLNLYSKLSYLCYSDHQTFKEKNQKFEYNFFEFNNQNIPLVKTRVKYTFVKKISENFQNTVDYANHMIIRKRNVPSKNLIKQKENFFVGLIKNFHTV